MWRLDCRREEGIFARLVKRLSLCLQRHLVSLFWRLPFARVCVPSIFDALSRYEPALRDAGITVMNLLAAAHRAAIYQFAFCREQ
jgi:hypothetical protein